MRLKPHNLFVGAIGGLCLIFLGGLIGSLFWYM